MKTLESPGSNQRHLADRKIALYPLSQILNLKTDSSLVNFRRMPFQSTQKTTEDVDNGHSKECRSFNVVLHWNTFKIRRPTAVHAGVIAHEHAAAKRGHRLFFLVREKGGFVRTPRTPLGYVPGNCFSFFSCKDDSDRLMKRASSSCCIFVCVVLAAAH